MDNPTSKWVGQRVSQSFSGTVSLSVCQLDSESVSPSASQWVSGPVIDEKADL